MLRLIADDLTGALDSVGPFARPDAPIPVVWRAVQVAGSLALDSESRDLAAADAYHAVAAMAPLLAGGQPAFKKLDSRLRGHPALEIAACARIGGFASIVVAPAFPAQGRITRQGRQHAQAADGWEPVPLDLPRALEAVGLHATLCAIPSGAGTFLCDAASEADLAAIAAAPVEGPVLWCGTGGLARALAGPSPAIELPRGRLRIVVGTNHPATRAQLAGLGARHGGIVRALDLPPGEPAAIEPAHRAFVAACATEAPPDLLLATGGETLLHLCVALDAERLDVMGELAPGIPVSRLVGGGWDGITVISKSGGFGAPGFFDDLIRRTYP